MSQILTLTVLALSILARSEDSLLSSFSSCFDFSALDEEESEFSIAIFDLLNLLLFISPLNETELSNFDMLLCSFLLFSSERLSFPLSDFISRILKLMYEK